MGSIYSKHVGRVILIFLFFYIAGFIIISSLESEVELEMVDWPTTNSEIIQSTWSIHYYEDDDGYTTDSDYFIKIKYRYAVEGEEFTSTRISISRPTYGSVDTVGEANAAIEKYSLGRIVTVTYHPTVHEYSVLEFNSTYNAITNSSIFGFFTFASLFLLFLGYPIFDKEVLFYREGTKHENLSVESLISDLPVADRKMFGVDKDGLKGSIENLFGMNKNDVPESMKYALLSLLMISGQVMYFGRNQIATAAILFRQNWLLFIVTTKIIWFFVGLSYAFSFLVSYVLIRKGFESGEPDDSLENKEFIYVLIALLCLLFVFLAGLLFTYVIAPFLIGLFFYISMVFYMPFYGFSWLIKTPIAGIWARYFALILFLFSNIVVFYKLPKYEITRRKGQIMIYTRDPDYYHEITSKEAK